MHDLLSKARHGVVTTLLAVAFMLPVDTTAMPGGTTLPNDENTLDNEIDPASGILDGDRTITARQGSMLAVSAFAPVFSTPDDARAFWHMAVRSYASPAPDAATTAKAFIQERLGIDGDAYVVAHFATPQMRSEGSADSAIKLTDAVMRAFPDHSRHTFFGAAADAVGGLMSGGAESPSAFTFVESLFTCKSVGECFSRIGRFLWSRTGPGYVYNTFIGKGNIIDTVQEDLRPLDEAFGIFPISSPFLPEHASPLLLSQVIAKFKEEGTFSELPYIKKMKAALDQYWSEGRSDWPLLARYQFVYHARWARGRGVLTEDQYKLVMEGGAPNVPLEGPITLQQLRSSPPVAHGRIRRFDINGYAASRVVRFISTDGSEVMYMPGAASPFVAFRNEAELRQWVVGQARNPGTLDELLSNFSIYNGQDGVFWTGVARGLANLADNQWTADSTTINQGNVPITGDVFDDMRIQVEAQLRDDARIQTRTAWDAWRTTINRTAALMGPLGYVPPLAIPIQAGSAVVGLGTGLEQEINGRTAEERRGALEQAVMTVVTGTITTVAISSPHWPTATAPAQEPAPPVSSAASTTTALSSPSSRAPQRAESRVGYVVEAISASRSQRAEDGQMQRRVFDRVGDDHRAPFNPLSQERGYFVQTLPVNAAERARAIINLKKAEIDETRHRMDDFRTERLRTNRLGHDVSSDHAIVYRVDSRTPRQLLSDGGFGPSMQFDDLRPMLVQPATIGSGSLLASNLVFHEWQSGHPKWATFHQYAVWTEGRPVASALDNHESRNYDFTLDEVHFPADVPTKDIYIVDSFNPAFADAIAKLYESRYVSTPYGVSLEMFNEYLAGRLDIDAPNRFTPRRLTGNFPAEASSSLESGSTLSIDRQPLSSSDTNPSDERTPLLRPPR